MIYVVMLLVAPSYINGGNDYRIIRKNVDTGDPSLIWDNVLAFYWIDWWKP